MQRQICCSLLLLLLLLLLCCAHGCAATAVVQELPQKGQGPLDAFTVSVVDSKEGDKWEPIRIGVYPGGLYAWYHGCVGYSPGGNSPFSFPTLYREMRNVICNPDTGITRERVRMLRKVAVEAAKLHSKRLKVQRVEVLKLDTHYGYSFKERCRDAVTHRTHLTKGIKGVDFALYLGLTKFKEEPQICTKDANKRPTSALIKLYPSLFNYTRHNIRLVAHEIGHALGFNFAEFRENAMLMDSLSVTGRRIMGLLTDGVRDKARKHFGCLTLNYVELDVLPGGSKYPHWKRRYVKDDLMSAYLDRPSAMYYTALTLATFDSMPFYQADFSKAEHMIWGWNASCEFLTEKCVEDSVSKFPKMFCNDQTPVLRCTTDRYSLGKCSMRLLYHEKVPQEFKYFSQTNIGAPSSELMDYCPAIEPTLKTSCEIGDEDEIPGSIVSNISRCLDVKSVVLSKNEDNGNVEGICAMVKCEDSILKVQYKGNNSWHDCRDGGVIDNLNGKVFEYGKIVCPNYTDLCGDKQKTSN
ncbi:Peptidase M8 [Trypanosoma melophagium]|uniref:Peptidase M8 n=1 Tax=Trypanosoma melophagium TaxID=715481 RepID=UPI00351A7E54|nr:Peptidase M8 [Trypanosoma melophagium]